MQQISALFFHISFCSKCLLHFSISLFAANICFIFPYLFLQQISALFFHISFCSKCLLYFSISLFVASICFIFHISFCGKYLFCFITILSLLFIFITILSFSAVFYGLYSLFTNYSQQPVYSSFSIFSKPKFTAFLRASSSSWLNIT